MRYRNQFRIAGLMVAASLFVGAPLSTPALAQADKPTGAAAPVKPLVKAPAGPAESTDLTAPPARGPAGAAQVDSDPADEEEDDAAQAPPPGTPPPPPAPAAEGPPPAGAPAPAPAAEGPPPSGPAPAPAAEGPPPGEDPNEDAAATTPEPSTAGEKAAAESAATPAPPTVPPPNRPLPADVPVPTDEIEKAAFDVLQKHCSRCHQAGLLTSRENPAKGFGNVLKLEEISANPSLIQAGNPEGSKLFQQLVNKEMPYDLYYEFDTSHPEVTPSDLESLRAWIKSTGDKEARACKDRKFVSSEDMVAAIAGDLQKQPDHRIKGMRYFVLTNLYNSCATDESLDVYRQGIVKLLNGFGRRSDVVKLVTVDPEETIVAINLQDMGWEASDWNTVLKNYPYAVKPDVKMYDFITSATDTPLPYVRADWFTFTASQPPLYDTLLQLPDTFQGLTQKFNVDLEANIKNFVAQRSGFQKSGVSQNNRLIERHPIATGYFWTSYDFGGSKGEQSLFLHPLGPKGENAFKHDGGESIFSLPNGFQGYFLNKADGTRLDKGPVQIVRDPSRRDLSVTNGISCMGCHDQGMRKAKDEVRGAILADKSFSKDNRETVEALYPETAKMDAMIEDDFQRFNSAMKRAGLDPTLKLNGVEMTNALYRRYEDDLSLRRAAAEYGFEPEPFKEAFIQGGPEAIALMRRLEQGIVPRDQFEALYSKFVETTTEDRVIDTSKLEGGTKVGETITPPAKTTFDLQLTADKTDYGIGDKAAFKITSSRECSLFVVNVSKEGIGTVIFPNKFESANAVKAGETIVLGGPSSPYKFSLPDYGDERVVAVCRVGGSTREAFGFRIDPKKQTFAEIPNFEKVVSRAIAVESQEAKIEAAGIGEDKKKEAQFEKIAAVTKNEVSDKTPESAKQTAATTAIVIHVK